MDRRSLSKSASKRLTYRFLLCALIGGSVFFGLSGSYCAAIPGTTPKERTTCSVDLTGLIPSYHYGLGWVFIFLHEDKEKIGEALYEAAQKGITSTGIAEFDSVGTNFGLKALFAPVDLFSKRYFALHFSDEADLQTITDCYCQFDYILQARPTLKIQLDTVSLLTSWGDIKEQHQRK